MRPARSRFPVIPVAIAAVLTLAAVAVAVGIASDGDGARTAPGISQIRPVEISGAALPPFAAGGDAAVGRTAPRVSGASFDGTPVEIVGGGTPKLLVFLAHWCPHCQAEVPVVVSWTATGRPEGVDLLAVSSSVDPARPNYPPSSWLDPAGWQIPTLADNEDGDAAAAYGLTGYPYFVAVTSDGTVAARATGEQGVAQLEALAAAARGGAGL